MTADGSFLSRVSRTKAPPPKEKFVSIMEGIFDGTLSGLRRKPATFFDEFFLLGCNARAVTELVASSSTDTLHARRESISALCRECVDRIGDGALLRRSRALELLCVVLLQISRAPFPERSLGVINTCAGGQDTCDGFFEDLIQRCATCAASHDLPVTLRRLALRAMLTVVAGVDDNLNRNALVQYFMMHDVYEPVMKVLIAPVDVPGGGVSSETHEGATAVAHGAGGFGSDTGIDGDEKNENENAAADDGVRPEAVMDAWRAVGSDAVDWLIASGIDRRRTGITGYSLGSYVAVDGALGNSRAAAAIGVAGGWDVYVPRAPRRRIPVMVIQSENDTHVSPESTRRWVDFLRRGDVPVRHEVVRGAGHIYTPDQWLEVQRLASDFFQRTLL